MTDQAMPAPASTSFVREEARERLAKRYRAERRFRLYGAAALSLAAAFLVFLIGTMVYGAWPAFTSSEVRIDVTFDPAELTENGAITEESLRRANFQAMARNALLAQFPDVTGRREKRTLGKLLSTGVDIQLKRAVESDPAVVGRTVPIWVKLSDDADLFVKGGVDRTLPESERRITDQEIAWLDQLEANGAVRTVFATSFFTNGDSREPELAGIWGAVKGSFLTLFVTFVLSFPIGVTAAAYLEEFAPKNRWTELIEVNINNLAAVPSIVFGLLGLAMFLNFFGLPRSAPLVGGMVLALMTLPTIIIATRAAFKAVPPSIREAALGVGASDLQVVTHHVLPLAAPGILTGSIIGMAGALGETAPLLMIGMVAFIVDIPSTFTDPATVLPVQIYIWADSPERAFIAKTSAATLVLLGFLIAMNGLGVLLRKKFERRW
jgi:phosphate transport system permease protein